MIRTDLPPSNAVVPPRRLTALPWPPQLAWLAVASALVAFGLARTPGRLAAAATIADIALLLALALGLAAIVGSDGQGVVVFARVPMALIPAGILTMVVLVLAARLIMTTRRRAAWALPAGSIALAAWTLAWLL